jgi:hypothetical protein
VGDCVWQGDPRYGRYVRGLEQRSKVSHLAFVNRSDSTWDRELNMIKKGQICVLRCLAKVEYAVSDTRTFGTELNLCGDEDPRSKVQDPGSKVQGRKFGGRMG